MKSEDWLAPVLITTVIVLMILGPHVERKRVTNHCSLTGTYVIDNDTVLACRVIKRNIGEAKPREPKEEEQSL